MYHNILFPKFLSERFVINLEFTSNKIKLQSGQEIRKNLTYTPIRKYNVSEIILSKEEFALLSNFFYSRNGSKFVFKMQDSIDNELKDELIGKGDGNNTIFKVTKKYKDRKAPYIRKIDFDLTNNFQIFITGHRGLNFKMNKDEITFSQPIRNNTNIRVSCNFYVKVRFNQDELEYKILSEIGKGAYGTVSDLIINS